MDLGVLIVFVETYHQLIKLIIQPHVEIPQENRPEPVLVEVVRDALDAHLAAVLVLEGVEVATRLYDHNGLVEGELEVLIEIV